MVGEKTAKGANEYLVLAAMAWAGYAGWAIWWVLPAVALTTAAGWWRKAGQLWRRPPRVPPSTKMIAYFVVGIVLDLALAILFYLAGRGLRWWLG